MRFNFIFVELINKVFISEEVEKEDIKTTWVEGKKSTDIAAEEKNLLITFSIIHSPSHPFLPRFASVHHFYIEFVIIIDEFMVSLRVIPIHYLHRWKYIT